MFDIAVLQDLQELLEGDFNELIQAYIRDLSTKVPTMVASLEKQDLETVQKLSHSLKGASKNIGVRSFAESCSTIEQLAKAKNLAELKAWVPKAEAQAQALKQKLSELFLNS